MSGHSKWSTIKRKKSKIDDERGKIFTKLSKEIIVAVRQGGVDPDGNFRLKLAIQNAKSNNVPNENINRAIQKAAGMNDADNYEELFYEGYGPFGVAVLCAVTTDNRNRTASELRYIFSRNDGNLGETGCVSWLFDRRGRLLAGDASSDPDSLLLSALEAGADDVEVFEDGAAVITSPDELEGVREALLKAGVAVRDAEMTMIPQNTVDIGELDQAIKILAMIDALEDNDDVRAVYANFNIADEILAAIGEIS